MDFRYPTVKALERRLVGNRQCVEESSFLMLVDAWDQLRQRVVSLLVIWKHMQRWQSSAYNDEMLIAAHEGLDDEASQRLNARLVLMLSNHIGDLRVLREALQAARQGL